MKYNKGDKVIIKARIFGHGLNIGDTATILSVDTIAKYYIVTDGWAVKDKELTTKKEQTMENVTKAVYKTAKTLLKANNTVTTLEVKTQLRKDYPTYHWIQNTKGQVTGVSEIMNDFATKGKFTYKDNGTYRTYSFPKSKTSTKVASKTVTKSKGTKSVSKNPNHNVKTISRLKAHDLMSNNGGRFFTATFTKKDGTERIMSCTYLKDQTGSVLGYIKVKDTNLCKKTPGNCIRNVNLQTLTKLSIGGKTYNVR